jgi:hypothetical protein
MLKNPKFLWERFLQYYKYELKKSFKNIKVQKSLIKSINHKLRHKIFEGSKLNKIYYKD